jgi:hypothetical protein
MIQGTKLNAECESFLPAFNVNTIEYPKLKGSIKEEVPVSVYYTKFNTVCNRSSKLLTFTGVSAVKPRHHLTRDRTTNITL